MAGPRRRRGSWLQRAGDAVLGGLAVGTLRVVRLFDAHAMANLFAAIMRRVGPWFPEHKIGRANLVLAYPDKSPAEIDQILRGVWDNLGRVGAEFAHVDRLWDYDRLHGRGRILDCDESARIATRLRDDGKPALLFAAHIANWEVAAAAAKAWGMDTTVVYRRPNIPAVSDAVIGLREGCMGTLVPTRTGTPFELIEALKRGSHVAMLVDQYSVQGVPVTFFGRRTRANDMIARLARHVECPIHGIRVVRYPGDRFQLRLTEAIEPARDDKGQIDVTRTMQVITGVIEEWVREHPEQWLWLHRRWRD